MNCPEWISVHTSDQVAEAVTFLVRKAKAVQAIDALHDHVFGTDRIPPIVTTVHRIHAARFTTALRRTRSHFDEGLSFTDWTSLVLMEEEGISTIATFDAGFAGHADVVGRS